MRRSSRGNPYHLPKGSPKGGQFTSKDNGVPVYNSDEYYRQRMYERFGQDSLGFTVTESDGNLHSNLRGEPTSTYIRYGNYDPVMVKPITNVKNHVKPFGGVWASPDNAERGWEHWCSKEAPEWIEDQPREELTLTGARILHVYSNEDLAKLPQVNGDVRYCVYLDFEKLAQTYDGIEVHMTPDTYRALYGWDCDSVVIFNAKVLSK